MNLTKISGGNGTRRRNGIACRCVKNLHKRLVRDLRRSVQVYVEGRRAIRNWTDRENRKHAYREIVASEVLITESSAALQ